MIVRAKSPRDYQRSKQYKAEHSITAQPEYKKWIGDRSMGAVKDYLYKVYNDPFFREQWPHARAPEALVLHNGGGRKMAAAGWDHWLSLPRWARHEYVVLHEVAHLLCYPHDHRHSPHGRMFCTTFLELIRYFMGFDVFLATRQAFIDHDVKFQL